MASLQDIRRRIRSVKNIQQITKAMDMVATSRLRRAKDNANNNRPYAEKTAEVVRSVAAATKDFKHPLLEEHAEGSRLILAIAADKGLAGAYSSNALKAAISIVEDKSNTKIIAVGRKTRDYFRHRNFEIVAEHIGISEKPQAVHAQAITSELVELFTKGGVKEVYMVYTRFVSAINCVPEIVRLLPFESLGGAEAEERAASVEYIYEPNAEAVLENLLPQYLFTMVYAALLQSAASELSSRMNAMSNATDNASELIGKLDLYYNKVRQAGITREITEIVGGAEALN